MAVKQPSRDVCETDQYAVVVKVRVVCWVEILIHSGVGSMGSAEGSKQRHSSHLLHHNATEAPEQLLSFP